MRERMRKIWYPGLVTSALAFVGQAIIFRNLSLPNIVHVGGNFLVISYQWMMLLVACGMLGAWICYREGGSPRERLFVSQTPVFVILAVMVMAFVSAVVLDRSLPATTRMMSLAAFATWAVVIPGISLLLGAVPVIALEQLERRKA